jgi:hypothetical protein
MESLKDKRITPNRYPCSALGLLLLNANIINSVSFRSVV